MKSLMSSEKKCWVCGTDQAIEEHHVFPGWARRKLSDKYGCTVYLCHKHHNEPPEGVHYNKALDKLLKAECQKRFEEKYSHEEFMRIFGKNWI
mgnify:FL=1